MKIILVSIIIPIYNSRDTLERLLYSIAMQTKINDIETIIVDDYSKDNCEDIIKKFSNLINIKFIKKDKNDGSGVTRNVGLQNANGRYIVFADSDDTFLNSFSIEKMIKDIESGNYDFASYGFVQERENLEFSSTQCNATWIFGKIYSKEFLDKWNIRFSNEHFNEDVAFNQICYALADNIYKSNDTLYLHHINKNSVTKTEDYENDDMCSFIRNYIYAYEFISNKVILTDKMCWNFIDGLLIMYNFYTEKLRTKQSDYCTKMYEQIVFYYSKIFDFAKDCICNDGFIDHYMNIFNTHGLHNKKLICTLDWYTFINMCEKSRKELKSTTSHAKAWRLV